LKVHQDAGFKKEAVQEPQRFFRAPAHEGKNSQDERLLKGSWPIHRLAKWPLINGMKTKTVLKGQLIALIRDANIYLLGEI